MEGKFDFSGWATRNDLKCSDGRTIRKDAFKHNDGNKVPLVWNHQHDGVRNILGHALLENREEGVYVYGAFNETEDGLKAKDLVLHGDITALSIYANRLQQRNGDVLHGDIREVSLVLAGANPGAYIDSVLQHSDGFYDSDDDAIIYSGEDISLSHAEKDDEEEAKDEKKKSDEEKSDKENKSDEKTVQDVIDSMNEDQKTVLYGMVGEALNSKEKEEKDGGKEEMKHNVFENENENVLSHSDIQAFAAAVVGDAKRYGSMKDSFIAHAEEYGIQDIDFLFPDDKNLNMPPEFIQRDQGWVSKIMNGVHHSPFSRIKSMFADITEDEARAKGYIKGKLKKEEVFSLLKRSTAPTTVYKKQKMDRDDIIDITDFDVIAWLKAEMRLMLNEEIARAILIGDGRLASSDDKINEDNIRPVLNDADLFVIRWGVAAGTSDDEKAKNFIRAAIKSRKNYKGSGQPTLYTTEDMLTDMLLLEDGIGHKLYKTEAELATTLRVKEIVTVPVMEGLQDKAEKDVYGIIVNIADYNVGADKGGAVNMFDDFDIDYNQQKYLIETRCSGALIKPFSAIVLREGENTKSEEPTLKEAKAQLRD